MPYGITTEFSSFCQWQIRRNFKYELNNMPITMKLTNLLRVKQLKWMQTKRWRLEQSKYNLISKTISQNFLCALFNTWKWDLCTFSNGILSKRHFERCHFPSIRSNAVTYWNKIHNWHCTCFSCRRLKSNAENE